MKILIKNSSIILIIFLVNCYVFLGGPAKKTVDIEENTNKIYSTIKQEVIGLGGKIISIRGRINKSFSLDINFNSSTNFKKELVYEKIEKLGFTIDEKKSQYNSYVFCKSESGFLVSGDRELTIDYNHKMFYCSN